MDFLGVGAAHFADSRSHRERTRRMSTPVENLVQCLHARRSGKGWTAKCPAHEDRKPSLSINEGMDGRALLKCQAGCDTNDVLAALGMTWRDLFPTTNPRSSGNGATPGSTSTFDWPACVGAFTAQHVEHLAKWRGYSREFCEWLRNSALVGLCEGQLAFPVHDCGNVVAAHVRQKDDSWRYSPKGTRTRSLIIGELIPGDPVHVFE